MVIKVGGDGLAGESDRSVRREPAFWAAQRNHNALPTDPLLSEIAANARARMRLTQQCMAHASRIHTHARPFAEQTPNEGKVRRLGQEANNRAQCKRTVEDLRLWRGCRGRALRSQPMSGRMLSPMTKWPLSTVREPGSLLEPPPKAPPTGAGHLLTHKLARHWRKARPRGVSSLAGAWSAGPPMKTSPGPRPAPAPRGWAARSW